MIRILGNFDWHHVSLIVDETDWSNTLIRRSMETAFRQDSGQGNGSYSIQLDVQSFTFRNQDGEIVNKTINMSKILQASLRAARSECRQMIQID